MLLVRGDLFIKRDNKLYIVGSASNFLYSNNVYYMRDIEVLGWLIDDPNYDTSYLEEFKDNSHIKLILYPFSKKIKYKKSIIKKEVKKCSSASLKLSLTDAMLAFKYVKRYKKPFVIESGTDSFNSLWYHGGSPFYKLAAVPMELLLKNYHRRSKYIVYVSKDYLQRKYPSKAFQIGCPDVALLPTNELVLEKRIEKIKKHRKPFVLGLIGATHAEYRGHDRLIEIMSKLVEKGYDTRVAFLGGGKSDDKRIMKAKSLGVLDRVVFCGRKNHNEVLAWIDDIDCLVMPTLAESLGRSIIEAMSRGCPVIGTLGTAIPEQIGSDCVVYPKDIDGFVRIIELMINNEDYLVSCSKENFYRANKYTSNITNEIRKGFYDTFYNNEMYVENQNKED